MIKHDLFTFHAWLGQRWGWWSAIPITLFWVILWPVGLLWFTASAVSRYAALDKSPEAVARRRAVWQATARQDNTARLPSRVTGTGLICWSLCWLPLVGQGLVPIILKLLGTDVKALFIAFYLPEAYQWPFLIAMVVLGAALLGVAIKSTRLRSKS